MKTLQHIAGAAATASMVEQALHRNWPALNFCFSDHYSQSHMSFHIIEYSPLFIWTSLVVQYEMSVHVVSFLIELDVVIYTVPCMTFCKTVNKVEIKTDDDETR